MIPISKNSILRKLISFFSSRSNRDEFKKSPVEDTIDATANDGDHQITINGKIIEMPASVREGLVFGDIFVVVLDVKYSMRNVFAFDETGKQIWQIEEPDVETKSTGYALVAESDGELIALFRGAQLFINPENGKIYDVYIDK